MRLFPSFSHYLKSAHNAAQTNKSETKELNLNISSKPAMGFSCNIIDKSLHHRPLINIIHGSDVVFTSSTCQKNWICDHVADLEPLLSFVPPLLADNSRISLQVFFRTKYQLNRASASLFLWNIINWDMKDFIQEKNLMLVSFVTRNSIRYAIKTDMN